MAISATLTLALLLLHAAPAFAQAKPESTYDRIWKFAEWYEEESNTVVQRVPFSGRYQHDFATVDADEGTTDEWNVRRLRLGPRVTLFRTFTVHAEVELKSAGARSVLRALHGRVRCGYRKVDLSASQALYR